MKTIFSTLFLLTCLWGCDGGILGAYHKETEIRPEQIPPEVVAQFKKAHPDCELDKAIRVSAGQEMITYYRLFFHLQASEADYLSDGSRFPPDVTTHPEVGGNQP